MHRFSAWLQRRASVGPADRGTKGELLIRPERRAVAREWLVAALLSGLALAMEVFSYGSRGYATGLQFVLVGAAIVAVLLGLRSLAFLARYRLAVTGDGLIYRRWWSTTVRVLPWDKIHHLSAGAGVEITPVDEVDFSVPHGLRGKDELIAALAAHVPRDRWDKDFAKEVARLESKRGASQIRASAEGSAP
jgi:hypothetical protein